jgi:hypothetical protein
MLSSLQPSVKPVSVELTIVVVSLAFLYRIREIQVSILSPDNIIFWDFLSSFSQTLQYIIRTTNRYITYTVMRLIK